MPTSIEIPNSGVFVDHFKFDGLPRSDRLYLLTHFHSDHYNGLKSGWSGATIVGSERTCRLVHEILGVKKKWIQTVPMRKRVSIKNGVDVYFVDANHCPGAVIFVMWVNSRVYLHTGDFRASASMQNDPVLQELSREKGQPEIIYLDTTYGNPRHTFPDRGKCVRWVGDMFERAIERDSLFLVSTYLLGKERILLEIEARMHRRRRKGDIAGKDISSGSGTFIVTQRKYDVLILLGLPDRFLRRLVVVKDNYDASDLRTADGETLSPPIVAVIDWSKGGQFKPGGWRFDPDYFFIRKLQDSVGMKSSALIVPTGWTYRKGAELGISSQTSETGNISVHCVPYSEHSSFDELRDFVRFMKPVAIYPTVVSFARADTKRQKENKIRAITNRFKDLIDRGSMKRKRFEKMFFSSKQPPSDPDRKKERKPVVIVLEDDVDTNVAKPEKCFAREAVQWACQRCTFLNHPSSRGCVMCESPRAQTSKTTLNKPSDAAAADNEIIVVDPSSNSTSASDIETEKKRSTSVLPARRVHSRPSGNSNSNSRSSSSDGTCKNNMALSTIDFDPTVRVSCSRASSSCDCASLVSVASTSTSISFGYLCKCMALLNATKKRLVITQVLVNCFRHLLAVSRTDVVPTFLLLVNSVDKSDSPFRGGTHTGKRDNAGEIGIGGGTVSTVVVDALGIKRAHLRAAYRKLGDLGDAAASLSRNTSSTEGACAEKKRKRQKLLTSFFSKNAASGSTSSSPSRHLTVAEIFEGIRAVALLKGKDSERRKKNVLVRMLRRCRKSDETRFLVRIMLSATRLGASTTTVICALARAVVFEEMRVRDGGLRALASVDAAFLKTCDETTKTCLAVHPSLPNIARALVKDGFEALKALSAVRVGVPICPMLASPIHDMSEVVVWVKAHEKIPDPVASPSIARLVSETPPGDSSSGDVHTHTLEYKYDGARVQVHCQRHETEDWDVKIFSRHLTDVTQKYTKVLACIRKGLSRDVRSCILDGEIVAVERDPSFRILPFQTLTNTASSDNALCLFFFDCIFVNGSSIVDLSLRQRRRALRAVLLFEPGHLEMVKFVNVTDAPSSPSAPEGTTSENLSTALERALDASDKGGCEGLMAKSLSSPYEAGKRGGDQWKKIKTDYVGKGVCDSLDVVPIGCWFGNGRKAGWYSPILVAVYDEETETYQSIGRIMSGLSDVFYKYLTERFGKIATKSKPFNVQTRETCSLWFAPPDDSEDAIATGVWEVRGADLTLSTKQHTAGSYGVGLRFPRFVRERKDIVNRSGVTTSAEIDEMYENQRTTKA